MHVSDTYSKEVAEKNQNVHAEKSNARESASLFPFFIQLVMAFNFHGFPSTLL